MIEIAAGARVYVDTNIFIYFIERSPQFHDRVRDVFVHIRDVGASIVTSEITMAECLHKPFRSNDRRLIETYELLFEQSGDIELAPLNGGLAKRAAAIGGPLGLKLIDAIHFASALEANCDVFLSSDAKFRSTDTMTAVTLG